MILNYPSVQGTNMQNEAILYVNEARIEEINSADNRTGNLLVSYDIETHDKSIKKEFLRLIISNQTHIMNEFAEPLLICDLEKGMYVDASFSSAMAMSLPPQSRAYEIIVRSNMPKVVVTTDRVIEVDVVNSFLFTGNPYEMIDQMRFVVSNATVILDTAGNRISLNQIKPGQLVRVEHAAFQTMSIPPQTTAFRIQVLS